MPRSVASLLRKYNQGNSSPSDVGVQKPACINLPVCRIEKLSCHHIAFVMRLSQSDGAASLQGIRVPYRYENLVLRNRTTDKRAIITKYNVTCFFVHFSVPCAITFAKVTKGN